MYTSLHYNKSLVLYSWKLNLRPICILLNTFLRQKTTEGLKLGENVDVYQNRLCQTISSEPLVHSINSCMSLTKHAVASLGIREGGPPG